jgi:hypothetical protein
MEVRARYSRDSLPGGEALLERLRSVASLDVTGETISSEFLDGSYPGFSA